MACGGRSSAVVWQWQDDTASWIVYEPGVSNFLEQSLAFGEKTADLGRVSAELVNYVVDLTTQQQRKTTTGFLRAVRRVIVSEQSPLTKGFAWQWLGDSSWCFYSLPAMEMLEHGRNTLQATVDLASSPSNIPYTVDLKRSQQISQASGFCRSIRRVPLGDRYRPVNDLNSSKKSPSSSPRFRSLSALLKRKKTSSSDDMGCVNSSCMDIEGRPLEEEGVEDVSVHLEAAAQPSSPFGLIQTFCEMVDLTSEQRKEECPICTELLSDESSYRREDLDEPEYSVVFRLNKCKHIYHAVCLLALRESSKEIGLRCPMCKTIHGIHTGNQPPGTVHLKSYAASVAGYENHSMIEIRYEIPPGIQDSSHPNPGTPFTCHGFPRKGYFPDTPDAREIVAMLLVAFERRLIFTVGMSATSGVTDTVTWNEIHHKTNWENNSNGHGYPDPNYLYNVREELRWQGVTPDDVEERHRQTVTELLASS